MNSLFTQRDICPCCEGREYSTLFECRFIDKPAIDYIKSKVPEDELIKSFSDKNYSLAKCSECELIFQRTILNDAGMIVFYNEWLPKSIVDSRCEKDQAQQHALLTQELFVLLKIIGRPAGDISILDFGMGMGRFCLVAKSMGFQITGSDIADQVLEAGAKNGIRTGRLEDLSNRQFDFINTEQVFEHLGNPRQILQKLIGLLKPGGIIRISVPNGRGIEKRLAHMDFSVPRGHRNYLIPVTPGQHVNTFTQSSLRSFGKNFGLEPISVPFWYQYCVIPAMTGKALIKNILRPFYQYLKKPTAIYFRLPAASVKDHS